MEKHHHGGHRERMRQRFMENGSFKNFADHEILEMLLYYALPRRDTNELAHKMLDEFKDLDLLLNSPPEAIANRTGVSLNTAVLLSMIGCIKNRTKPVDDKNVNFFKTADAKKYFISFLKDEPTECFYIVCLNAKKQKIKTLTLVDGFKDHIELRLSELLANIKLYGTAYVVCAHNHPSGTKKFSYSDINSTLKLSKLFDEYGIKLVDHILVCGDEAVSMSERKDLRYQ